ncbi:MAG: pilin [Thiolinea sp.]
MTFTHHLHKLFLCSSLFLFITCVQAEETKTLPTIEGSITTSTQLSNEQPGDRTFLSASEDQLGQDSYLRERLPDSTIAYIRIPYVWDILGSSRNSADTAVSSQEFVNAKNSIKKGVSANLIPTLPKESNLLAQIIAEYANSPLELAILKNSNNATPAAEILATLAVDLKQPTFDEILARLSGEYPMLQFHNPENSDNITEITISGLKGQILFHQKLSRVFFSLGVNSIPKNLEKTINKLPPNNHHPMLASEKTVDSTGRGLLIWTNPSQLYEIAEKTGVPETELEVFSKTGLNKSKSATLGSGSSNDISKLKVLFEMPVSGIRSLIPTIHSTPTFQLKGKTNFIATLGLPTKSHIMSYETLASLGSAEGLEGYFDFKENFEKNTGISFEDIFELFGQDVSMVSSEIGTYFAIRMKNQKVFTETLSKLVDNFKLTYKQQEMGGHTYHHLQIPALSVESILNNDLNHGYNKIVRQLLSVPTHLYWEQEKDYLLVANIPQILMDRHNVSQSIPANKWLKKNQRMNADNALLMVSAVTPATPKAVYRMQLSMLSYMGDIAGQPIDLFKLPTPHKAKLPDKGAYGLKLTSSNTQLALELNFENNPFELIGGSTYASILLTGLVAFTGITAQETYTTQQGRAKLIPGISAAKSTSQVLDEYKSEYGNYPGQIELDALALGKDTETYTLSVEGDTGHITVEFKIPELLWESTLLLSPPFGDSPDWKCSSDIEDKYLPKSCH